ncbi:MAG: FmdB family transcriptional regulator [Solimicrobium sp.]|nr:FmdB family transcriptional regulator [Solimicrobium sp.]
MPIYPYRCDECGFSKDILQKISDPLLTVCPSCGAPALKKQVTAAGFQLKGSGWYATDFKGTAAPSSTNEVQKNETGQSSSPDSANSSTPSTNATESTPAQSAAPASKTPDSLVK